MDIAYLREFLDLANTLNFTKTAANLHMAQSTLSRHIGELEHQVGAPLFDRTPTSVRLTAAGRLVYKRAQSMVAGFDEMLGEVHQAAEVKNAVIRVCGSTIEPTVNRMLTKLASRAVIEGAPLRFQYVKTRSLSNETPTPFAFDMLRSGEIDLAIDLIPPHHTLLDEFATMPLADERLFVFASADNPLVQRSHLSIDDLKGNIIFTQAVFKHCPELLSAPFIDAGFNPHDIETVFIGNTLEMPVHLAELTSGQLIPIQENFCHAFGFGQDGSGSTATLDMDDKRLKVRFYAAWRKDDGNPAVAQALDLLDTIMANYRAAAGPADWSELPSEGEGAGGVGATDGVLWSNALYRADTRNESWPAR